MEQEVQAELGSMSCSWCELPLRGSYFNVGGRPACEGCRYEQERRWSDGPGAFGLLRALLAGSVAAALGCAIYYMVIRWTEHEYAAISILVGLMVGAAVRWGSQGRGGWPYQVMAVGLTYLAIVATYIPFMFEAAQEQFEQSQAESSPVSATRTAAPSSGAQRPTVVDQSSAAPEQPDLLLALQALAQLLLLAAIIPFLQGFNSVLAVAILGFGLYQAWSMTRRRALTIEGPVPIGAAPAAAPSA
jgi:hypothetical protein